MKCRSLFPLAVCAMGAVAGLAAESNPTPKSAMAPEDLGAPLKNVTVYNGGYGYLPNGKADGRPVVALVVRGGPGILTVLDAGTREIVFSAPLPGDDDGSSAVEMARDGTVYVGGTGGGLYSWRSGDTRIRRLAQMDKVILSVREAPNGHIYVGTFPTGRLFRYDPKAGRTKDLGPVVKNEQYANSLAFDGEMLYIGVGTHPHLICYDTRTGKKRGIALPAEVTEGGPSVGNLAVAGRRLFGSAGKSNVFVMDLDSERIVNKLPEIIAQGAAAAPPRNGKTYIPVKPGTLLEYDLATDTARPAPRFRATGYTRDFGWLKWDGHERLVTTSWGGGLWAYDPETGQESLPVNLEGQPVSIQAMEKGPDGRIYVSGYPGSTGARFDPKTDTTENFGMGQAEGMGALGSAMYMGIYPKAAVWKMETDGPLKAPVKVFDIGADQDRPFAFASGAGKVFIGTVPGYGLLGGALTVYDPETGEHTAHRNVIPDQSLIRLVYHDGLVYGSTSIWGGLGQDPKAEAAVVFAWDPATGRVVRSATPSHPSLKEAPKAINGLAFGPDGRLWAAWQGTLIRMDPKTFAVDGVKVLTPSNWNVTHSWEPKALRFTSDGTLFASLSGSLTEVNPDTLATRVIGPGIHIVVGDDGALYTSHKRHLYRYRLR